MTEIKKWNTEITGHFNEVPHVRGYDIRELMEKVTFTDAIFLVLRGELPTEKERKMLNAMLISMIDHGLGAPSTTAARIVASCGTPMSTAVAAGVSAIGEHHAGAIEQCAKLLQEKSKKPKSIDDIGKDIVDNARLDRTKIPGYGHKLYVSDPRTETLVKIASELGIKGRHTDLALSIEKHLEIALGKKQCLNIDGIIAALMSDMGFPWEMGKGMFIIGRVSGLVAHVYEEQTKEKPFRRLSEEEMSYSGKEKRSL